MSEKNETPAMPFDDVVGDALASMTQDDAHAIDDKALLTKYGFSDLEGFFTMRDPVTQELLREKEPCFECLSDGFYGQGLHGTYWPEGAIIILNGTPNQNLRPLNRAAGIAYGRWMESLPQNRTYIDIGDMSEAAVILAKDERVKKMTPMQVQNACIRVAEGLRLKREGKTAMDLRAGDISRNFSKASGGNAPPMVGAKMSDMSRLAPGATRALSAVSGPGADVRRGNAANPLGGPPPGR